MRLTVRRVLMLLATYEQKADLFRDYPELEEADLKQALSYAAENLPDVIVDLPAA
jgi:uncharacterized protein (DUF433 family)